MCDELFFNPADTFKEWYTTYGGEWRKNIARLNTVTLPKVNLKSINDVNIPDRASNKLRGDVIRLGVVYVCDDTHNEILEAIFSSEDLHYYELILEGGFGSSDDKSECNGGKPHMT